MAEQLSREVLSLPMSTERPVLFLDVPLKIKNQRFRELGIGPLELSLRSEIGVVVPLEELDTVSQLISKLIANGVFYKKRIAKLRKQDVYAFGHSSDIGAQHIIHMVDK
jgi:YidC/Oxa1 family membrane protein insertase